MYCKHSMLEWAPRFIAHAESSLGSSCNVNDCKLLQNSEFLTETDDSETEIQDENELAVHSPVGLTLEETNSPLIFASLVRCSLLHFHLSHMAVHHHLLHHLHYRHLHLLLLVQSFILNLRLIFSAN